MMNDYANEPRKLYRSRRGMIFGVCRGVAEYMNFSVFWMRVIAVALMIFGWFFPVVAIYFLAGLLMKPEPVVPLRNDDEGEFYNSYATSRSMAIHRLKRTFDHLDRRIQRMENLVTSKEYDWDRRMNG
jgi:phage shock protein C